MLYSAFNDRMNLLAERPSLREKVRLIQAAAQKAEWVETALEHKRLEEFVYTPRI
jgi:trehalose-6-phosphate synthase